MPKEGDVAAGPAGAVPNVVAGALTWAVFVGILEGNWTRCWAADGEAARSTSAANTPDFRLGNPTTVPLVRIAKGKRA